MRQRELQRVRNHTVVIGYGTKGKTAVAAMVGDGVPPGEIVVVDTDQASLDTASAAGLKGFAALSGYKPPMQMVFCDFFPSSGEAYDELRDALEWLVSK